jgi:ADP-ribose pyrophosphatase YjhB (NUDIX family)
MQRRAGGCGAGCWSLPGGRVHMGEAVRSAAVRNAAEEVNLRIPGTQIAAVTEDECSCGDHWVTFWLISVGTVEGRAFCNGGDSDQLRWVQWGDWPSPLWKPFWDNLFTALNSQHQVDMAGGIRS